MRLEIKHPIDKPFGVPASDYLEATKLNVSAIPEKGLRHPLGMYNVSLASVISSAFELLDDLDKAGQLVGKSASDRVLAVPTLANTTKQFLLSNAEHVDACEKVVSAYLPSKDKPRLKKAKEVLRGNLGWYEKHVMAQANHIKHRHAQVRNLCLYTNALAVPGYFIEGAIGPEAVGPDPQIHTGNTAFSYARELRVFVCGLIYVSRSLHSVLQTYVGRAPLAEPKETPRLRDLVVRISRFSSVMFPDEYGRTYPVVECGSQNIKVSFGGSRTPRMPYNQIGFQTITAADGATRSFQIPYMDAGKV